MIIYLCLKFQFNTPIFSKDIARKPFVLRTGRTDVRIPDNIRNHNATYVILPFQYNLQGSFTRLV